MLFTRLAFFLSNFSVWILYLVINFYFRQIDDEMYNAFIYGIPISNRNGGLFMTELSLKHI